MPGAKPTFVRLIPILHVRDLDAEVAFYQHLGLEISYQGHEFPGFIALRCAAFEFGLQAQDDFTPHHANTSFAWQMEVDSFQAVLEVCRANGYAFTEPRCYWEERDSWEMRIQSPNGWTLCLETYGWE